MLFFQPLQPAFQLLALLPGLFGLKGRLQFLKALIHFLLTARQFLQAVYHLTLFAPGGVLWGLGLTFHLIAVFLLGQVQLVQFFLTFLIGGRGRASFAFTF